MTKVNCGIDEDEDVCRCMCSGFSGGSELFGTADFYDHNSVISVGYDSSEAVFYEVYYKVQENSYSPNL